MKLLQDNLGPNDQAYGDLLREIKSRVVSAHLGAARAVNRALIGLYWDLGRLIVERQDALGWGKAVVEKLSADLRHAFPEQNGFSPQNLWLMRQLYAEYRDTPILQQLVGEILWGQNLLILQKVKTFAARQYYLEATARMGWTRNVLLNQIKANAYKFTLKSKANPIGVAEYQLCATPPEELRCRLPSEEDWQRLLNRTLDITEGDA